MTSNSEMTKAKPLAMIPRNHFFVDPVFTDCWHVMENQIFRPFTETVHAVLDGKHKKLETHVPWRWDNIGRMMEMYSQKRSEIEKSFDVETAKDSYKVLLDVQHFGPDELSVSVTDRGITINGKHEEKDDATGTVSREFCRNYILPEDVVMNKLDCNLSSDGVLHITAPRKHDALPAPQDNKCDILRQMPKDDGDKIEQGLQPTHHHVDNDERMASCIQALPDFDMVPFWSRHLTTPNTKFGIKSDKHKFRVLVDAWRYTPEEISVHTAKHNIKVEGYHEENENGHGFMTRNFSRTFYVPKGVSSEEIQCNLSSNGVLEITAPKHKKLMESNESLVRVPIMMNETPISKNTLPNTADDKIAIFAMSGEQPAVSAPGY